MCLSVSGRIELIKILTGIVPQQLEQIISALNVPHGIIPPNSATQGGIVPKLLEWVESPAGRGLRELLDVCCGVSEDLAKVLIKIYMEIEEPHIYLVLLVMNRSEAQELNQELNDERVFCDCYDRSIFPNLKEKITKLSNWVSYYQDQENYGEWQPFFQTNKNIKELIKESFSNLETPIIPKIIDAHDLNQDDTFAKSRDIRENRCIVIMDTISMYHPNIQSLYKSPAIDLFSKKTSVVMIDPINSLFDIVTEIKIIIRQTIDLKFKRHREYINLQYEKACEEIDLENCLQRQVLLSSSENIFSFISKFKEER